MEKSELPTPETPFSAPTTATAVPDVDRAAVYSRRRWRWAKATFTAFCALYMNVTAWGALMQIVRYFLPALSFYDIWCLILYICWVVMCTAMTAVGAWTVGGMVQERVSFFA